jgi:hypothetical protein
MLETGNMKLQETAKQLDAIRAIVDKMQKDLKKLDSDMAFVNKGAPPTKKPKTAACL